MLSDRDDYPYGALAVYQKSDSVLGGACVVGVFLLPGVFKKFRKTQAGKSKIL